jgi:putative aldouronate transport system substrate-binding protein
MSRKLPIVLVLASTLLYTLTGCSTSTSNNDTTGSPAANKNSNFNQEGLPIAKEPITLNVLTVRYNNMGDTFTKNKWLQELEKQSNVKINWEVQSTNDWATKKTIIMADGKLPDIIFGDIVFTDSDIVNNISSFRPLDDYIDKYMPNLKAAMKESPEMKKISTFPDGKIYSLPARLPSRPVAANLPIINKVWLDRLGLKPPTNIDELYTVLKAFKEKDPNGNGKQDEIPFTGSKNTNWVDFLSPFGFTDLYGNNFNNTNISNMILKDGKPVFFPATKEYKEGLKWANKLFSEGLIDKEIFVQDSTMRTAKRDNPDIAIIGFDYGWTPDAPFKKWKDEYVAIPPLAGPDGKRYQIGDPNGLSFRRNELLISASCKYPEIAARWADQFYTNEASIQNFWGAIGTVIEKKDNSTYTLMDPPKGTSADAWYWEQSVRDFGPKYVSPGFEKNILLSPNSGDGLKLVIDKLGKDYVTPPFPHVMHNKEEFQELPTLLTDINSYISQTRAKWVLQGGIDAEWDAYVKKLNDMGLGKLVKIHTDAYNRYMSIK